MVLELARKPEGNTTPNPLVGALLVKGGKIVGRGYHRKAGLPHAEIEALKRSGSKAKGATLYVNLEPCDHFGKTPPCTDKIIERGIKRVVIGMRDPNPINCGRGIKKLKRKKINIKCNVLKKESRDLNRVFNTYITKDRPYVTVKAAQSLDGKIATASGESKWITGKSSRRFVHRLRSKVDAVLVGVNTVIKDNPLLTSRIKNARKQPVRVVLDSNLRISLNSKIIRNRSSKVIIATTPSAPKKKASKLRKMGIDVVSFGGNKGRVKIRLLLKYLAKNEISHLLVEGGGTVTASFIDGGFVDEMLIFVSPRIIGGKDAPTSVEGRGVISINNAFKLNNVKLKRFNKDILIRGNVYRHN